MTNATDTGNQLRLISEIAFRPENCDEITASIAEWDRPRLDEFIALLREHHVVLRVLCPLEAAAARVGRHQLREMLQTIIAVENERIRIALECLNGIVEELESCGCAVVLFKTLDHWPDFGSDLDLCAIGDERYILRLFSTRFQARQRIRTIGDILAHKWTFKLGRESTEVEMHINRLGHAGEYVDLASRFIARRTWKHVNGFVIPVPSPEECVIAATLHRMFRHLYFRVCDMINLSTLVQNEELCYRELRAAADECGIWPGVAACLKIASEYAERYLRHVPALPPEVQSEAHNIGGDRLFLRGSFFHLPLVPDGIGLFFRRFAHLIRNRDFTATARLSMLPTLASAGSLAGVVTGNSGYIW